MTLPSHSILKPWIGFAALLAAVLLFANVSAARTEGAAKTALAWTDVNGRNYTEADLKKAKATVFFFSSTQCPIANLYTPRMVELAKEYMPRGVRFFLVNSNPEDSREKVVKYARERRIPFPAVKDNGTELADRLGAQMTPQAILLDSKGNIRYLGRIDDNKDRAKVARHDLREALDAILAGRPVKQARTLPFGCIIFRDRPTIAATNATVTYTRDIAPILNANCVVCHRAGEVAPFTLETYAQARVWARQIKDYTARRLMPPWKAVPGYGEFHDKRWLTDEQIALIAKWADSGAPQGDPKDLPPAPKFPDPNRWTLGQPDLVLQPVRPYHLAAEGEDVYRNFVLPIDFKEDRYVQAMEFKPDNRAVVHHIVTYIDPTARSAEMDGKETEPGYTVPGVGIGIENAIWGEVWVPGNEARRLPPGIAIKIPAGAKLVMQVHYHKTGKPEVDRSRMALYFAKGKVEKRIHTFPLGTFFLAIPPGRERHEVQADYTLPLDVQLRSIFPHMHMLGREMKVTATLPNGTVKPLIYINDWDFNWQATYYYKEPLALPKGTKLHLVAYYDNSEKNPRQTAHPPRLVTFGPQTTDEMCFAFLGLTVDRENLNAQVE